MPPIIDYVWFAIFCDVLYRVALAFGAASIGYGLVMVCWQHRWRIWRVAFWAVLKVEHLTEHAVAFLIHHEPQRKFHARRTARQPRTAR